MEETIRITAESRAEFQNRTALCVGTGRLGLALHREYQEELAAVQEACHFRYIRGHGLFHDDLSIWQSVRGADGVEREGFCFTYLDRVIDAWRACGLRPFLELGFVPGAIASSEQTLFYWKGHTVPPRDEGEWVRLVQATLRHLIDRYGAAEVAQWPCEVWNEPNLPGFWEHADREKYLRLYAVTSRAVKEVLPEIPVGGPAVCGGESCAPWIRAFLTFCDEENLPLDFLSRHAYMAQTPQYIGRYVYHTMCRAEDTMAELRETREIIDSYPRFRGMPMHVTEFNSSYNPRCPIHDTAYNAAVMAELLSRLGEVCESYSYWTFGDVFEETGVPPRPFHGGFGLMAAGCVPKPTLHAFRFYSRLEGACVYRGDHAVLTRRADGVLTGVAWNRQDAGAGELTLHFCVPAGARRCLTCETVAPGIGDPLAVWEALGEPASLSAEQEALLREAAHPAVTAQVLPEGCGEFTLNLPANAVAGFTLREAPLNPDPGYDYAYYTKLG